MMFFSSPISLTLTFSQVSEVTLSTKASPKRSAFCLSIPHSTRRRWVVIGGFDERGLPRSGVAQGNQSKRFGTTTHKHKNRSSQKAKQKVTCMYTFEMLARKHLNSCMQTLSLGTPNFQPYFINATCMSNLLLLLLHLYLEGEARMLGQQGNMQCETSVLEARDLMDCWE